MDRRTDRSLFIVGWGAGALLLSLFFAIAFSVLKHGGTAVSWMFLVSMPTRSGVEGGILPVLVSTAAITAIGVACAVPLALGGALWLASAPADATWTRLVRLSVEVLAGVPSVVFGLFGNALFCGYLKMGYSIASGGLTLACMLLPLILYFAEAGISSVPTAWSQSMLALGFRPPTVMRRLLLPVAMPAIQAGIVLAVGRALSETAALLFTSGYVDSMPTSVFDSGRTLSVHIYELSVNVIGGDRPAYASTVVLMGLVLLINGASLAISRNVLGRELCYQ